MLKRTMRSGEKNSDAGKTKYSEIRASFGSADWSYMRNSTAYLLINNYLITPHCLEMST